MYSYVSSEVQRRRSSLLLPAEMFGQHNDSILIRLSPDVGVEGEPLAFIHVHVVQ